MPISSEEFKKLYPSGDKQLVLDFLVKNGTKAYYLEELCKMFKWSKSKMSKTISTLELEEKVRTAKKGRRKYVISNYM